MQPIPREKKNQWIDIDPRVIQIGELADKEGKTANLNIFHMFKALADVAPLVGHCPVHQKGC